MAHRILTAIRHVLRDQRTTAEVHFHRGPDGRPAPCFDQRCASPHLDPLT